MEDRIVVNTPSFSPIAPYSQGIKSNGFVFTSGCIGVDSQGKLVSDTLEEQALQALENLKSVLEEAGTSLEKCVKVTVYLSNMDQYTEFNKIYSTYFVEEPPARTCFAVLGLPLGALVEIDCIAAE